MGNYPDNEAFSRFISTVNAKVMARATQLERMQERIPESDYQQLQYVISESGWDAQGVTMDVARRTQASLSGRVGEQRLIHLPAHP